MKRRMYVQMSFSSLQVLSAAVIVWDADIGIRARRIAMAAITAATMTPTTIRVREADALAARIKF